MARTSGVSSGGFGRCACWPCRRRGRAARRRRRPSAAPRGSSDLDGRGEGRPWSRADRRGRRLERLGRAVREARADVDDQGLTDLLDQIETRAAVELAKREPPGVTRIGPTEASLDNR